ncbi:MAG TPA: SDR family oxidoreductase [Candidatus Krumholzibacteria bacterium]|nr:SDR family oxidoreductase [Candidatus Krumholzibacteria bacterium]HPD71927.1 SDR family oxidoreductase [Candidatus Krumholzibacteria bacterium]HRY41140.1 SDR family oxidoreductase [Candidatus Krumholzibacteria bacterium]
MNTTSLDLAGRRALVTGASRGLGRHIAILLAQHGARVALHCRAVEHPARLIADHLPGKGHAVVTADLADLDQAAALPGRAAAALGGLDILVNNAGIYERMPAAGEDLVRWRDLWERTIAVNLTAPALISAAAVPLLAERQGYIVNVSSRGAFRGEPEAPAYGASKSGLNALGQSMAVALARRGIKVITVAPAWVETDMTRDYLASPEGDQIRAQFPGGQVVDPDDLAWTVLLAVSGRADALTGAVIDLNSASYLR